VACDNNATSPFFGHCYAEWDDNLAGDVIFLNTSTDGGLTWGPSKQPAGGPTGLGGMPMAKPNGAVIVPSSDAFLTSLIAYGSRDGGNTWSSAVTIAFPSTHLIAGGLRDLNLPSAAMDAAGRSFVVWHDCKFRTNCSSNDIVFSTSQDGRTWSPAKRIPIDAVNSTVDHFILFLPADDLHRLHLQINGRIYFFVGRRQNLDSAHHSSRTDEFELASHYFAGADGGGLPVAFFRQRRIPSGVCVSQT